MAGQAVCRLAETINSIGRSISSDSAGHAAIFGDPSCATAEAGQVFIDTVVEVLEETFRTLRGSYEERR